MPRVSKAEAVSRRMEADYRLELHAEQVGLGDFRRLVILAAQLLKGRCLDQPLLLTRWGRRTGYVGEDTVVVVDE